MTFQISKCIIIFRINFGFLAYKLIEVDGLNNTKLISDDIEEDI